MERDSLNDNLWFDSDFVPTTKVGLIHPREWTLLFSGDLGIPI
jgi:hypothetical protein